LLVEHLEQRVLLAHDLSVEFGEPTVFDTDKDTNSIVDYGYVVTIDNKSTNTSAIGWVFTSFWLGPAEIDVERSDGISCKVTDAKNGNQWLGGNVTCIPNVTYPENVTKDTAVAEAQKIAASLNIPPEGASFVNEGKNDPNNDRVIEIRVMPKDNDVVIFGNAYVESGSSAVEPDANLANNMDTVELLVGQAGGKADLEIVATGPGTSVEVTKPTFEYTVTATNLGPENAPNVYAVDILPLGVSFVNSQTCYQAQVNAPEFHFVTPSWWGLVPKAVKDPIEQTIQNTAQSMNEALAKLPSAGVVCDLGDLNPPDPQLEGEDSPNLATAVINVQPNMVGTFVNQAEVFAPVWDPDPLNNVDFVLTSIHEGDIENLPDLAVTMTAASTTDANDSDGLTVDVGGTVTYTLVVDNLATKSVESSTASDVVLTDTLPLELRNITVNHNDCKATTGQVTCRLGTLAANDDPIAITITGTPTRPGVMTNQAIVTSGKSSDQNLKNNFDQVAVTATEGPNFYADLQLTMREQLPELEAGFSHYYLTLTNVGPADATGVILTIPIPPEAHLIDASTGQNAYHDKETGALTMTTFFDLVPAGVTLPDTFFLALRPKTPAHDTNLEDYLKDLEENFELVAKVGANEPDPDHENNKAVVNTISDPLLPRVDECDIEIVSISDNKDPVRWGEEITYTATIKNNGPMDVKNGWTIGGYLNVAGTHNIRTSVASRDPDVSYACGDTSNSGTPGFMCTTASDLEKYEAPDNKTHSVTFTATVADEPWNAPGSYPDEMILAYHFTAYPAEVIDAPIPPPQDKADENNLLREQTIFLPPGHVSDIQIVMLDYPETGEDKKEMTYKMAVTTDNPPHYLPATGVVVTDKLPDNVDFVSATPVGASQYNTHTREVTWNLGMLDDWGERSTEAVAILRLTVTPKEEGEVKNQARVQANEHDPDPSNNQTAEVTTTISKSSEALPNLVLTKDSSHDKVHLGDTVTYTLTVTNVEDVLATGVKLTDTLPTELAFTSAKVSANGGTCEAFDQNSRSVTCHLDDLGLNDTRTVKIDAAVVGVDPNETEPIVTNEATVTLNGNDLFPKDNTSPL